MTEKEFFEILDTQVTIVNSHRDLCLSFIQDQDNDLSPEDWFSLVMASQFNWLYWKFSVLWHENTNFDGFLTKNRPQYDLFSSTDFEVLVQSIMYLVFEKYYETTQGSHDQGIDLIITERYATSFGSMEISMTSIVQCKLYRESVPVSEVRDFFGVMVSRTATGYFFTTSSLSKQATEKFLPLANASSMANKLHVITNKQLKRLLDTCKLMADEVLDAFFNKRPLDNDLLKRARKNAKIIFKENMPQQPSLF